MEIGEVRAALSPEGLALLQALPRGQPTEALAVGESLRKLGHRPEVVAAAMTQARLQEKARRKFGDFALGMAFTPDGLEQASRLEVAGQHAGRFVDAGIDRVADLTAGIGADAMAFSALGIAVMAFERDEATALVADHNLRHWPGSVVVHADSLSVVRDVDVDGVFADPSRRTPSGRRTHRPENGDPPLSSLMDLKDRFPALGVKLGPGIPHRSIPSDAEAEWVSVRGEVVEAALWCGPLARRPGRSALLLEDTGIHRLVGHGAHAPEGPLSEYLYEPDGAVIRAGLVGEVGDLVQGHLLDATIAYVVSNLLIDTPFASSYRIVDSLPFGVKTLRAYLRERNVGRVTVKKRGTAVTPEALRASLRLRGDAEATLVLTRVAGAQRVLIVERATPLAGQRGDGQGS